MHDVVLVQVVDRQKHLIKDVKSFLLCQFLLLFEIVIELLSFYQLADDVVIFCVFVHSVNFNDVWVVLYINISYQFSRDVELILQQRRNPLRLGFVNSFNGARLFASF